MYDRSLRWVILCLLPWPLDRSIGRRQASWLTKCSMLPFGLSKLAFLYTSEHSMHVMIGDR